MMKKKKNYSRLGDKIKIYVIRLQQKEKPRLGLLKRNKNGEDKIRWD